MSILGDLRFGSGGSGVLTWGRGLSGLRFKGRIKRRVEVSSSRFFSWGFLVGVDDYGSCILIWGIGMSVW